MRPPTIVLLRFGEGRDGMPVQQPQPVQRVEDGAGAARSAVEQLAGHHALPQGHLLFLELLVTLFPAGRRRRG